MGQVRVLLEQVQHMGQVRVLLEQVVYKLVLVEYKLNLVWEYMWAVQLLEVDIPEYQNSDNSRQHLFLNHP